MILPDLTSRKYFRWLMVAVCKLNSESKAKIVLFVSGCHLVFQFKKAAVKCLKGGGQLSSIEYMSSQYGLKMFYSLSSWRIGVQKKVLVYFPFQTFYRTDCAFFKSPFLSDSSEKTIHSSRFQKDYWLLMIMNLKKKQTGKKTKNNRKKNVTWALTFKI